MIIDSKKLVDEVTPKINWWKWGDRDVFVFLKINQNRQGGRKFDGLSEYVVALKKAAYFHENFVKIQIPIFFQAYILLMERKNINRNRQCVSKSARY